MNTSQYILALDQGTTSSRSIIFDRSGKVISSVQKEYKQHYPKPGWVEHDPLDIWASQYSTAAGAVSKANLSTREIAAVGITNQRETTIVWDRETGKPIYNAIVWQDRRTAAYCEELRKEGVEPMIREKTGLRLDPYFSGTKIRWILENVNGAKALAEKGQLLFGTVDTWLIWQLTNHEVHVTDASNASRTLLLNIHTQDWDEDLLKLFGIPRSMLPELRSSSEVYGEVNSSSYPAAAPIAGIAGDQQAALFGQACFESGMVKNTYGTGCFTLMNTGSEAIISKNNLLTTIAWNIGGKVEYALEGSVFVGGALVQWMRDELRIVSSAHELDQLADSVPSSKDLYIVPAFTGLGAPHWDPYARGLMIGITRGTNRADLCRAALDAIAFQTADLISAMEKDSGLTLSELRVDGGASRSHPLLKFQADLLGKPVIRPKNVETTAMGAAYLAGLAVGYWESRDDIIKNWEVDHEFKPDAKQEDIAKLRSGWNRALERAKGWETEEEN